MKVIKLTKWNSLTPVFVNLDRMLYMEPGNGCTKICMCISQHEEPLVLRVIETPEDILAYYNVSTIIHTN